MSIYNRKSYKELEEEFDRINKIIFNNPRHNSRARSVPTGKVIEGYEDKEWTSNIRHFEAVELSCIEQLLDLMDLSRAANRAPSQASFVKFMKDNPGFTCIGFATSPKRDYVEISITGIDFHGEHSTKQYKAFMKFAKFADELTNTLNYLRAWWD